MNQNKDTHAGRSKGRLIAVVVILLLVFTAGYAFRFMSACSFNPEEFDRIKPGMKRDEVEQILGKPSGSTSDQIAGDLLFYGSNFTFCRACIFYQNDTVVSIFHDH